MNTAERVSKQFTRHGEASAVKRTREYKTWAAMKRRCNNPNCDKFKFYGGRGIGVCSRWSQSYEAFLADMGRCPSSDHVIDRRDSNGHYEPNNCRWITRQESMNNMRSSHFVVAFGERLTLAQWSKRFGINPATISRRLKSGWKPSDAIVILPLRLRRKMP